MNNKLIIYVLAAMFSTFSVNSLDLNRFFKQGRVVEANVFVLLLILSLAELVSTFIINFLEVSKIL